MGLYSTKNIVQYHAGVTNAQSWANAINKHWKHDVARAAGGYVTSRTLYGVPLIARVDGTYQHPDIVRVRRFGHVWNIVEP